MSTAPAAPARTVNRTGLLALLFAGFTLIGIPTVIIGPILPLFISRWSLNDSQAGLFFTVQFAAALCGVWITTALTAWRGYRPGLALGYLLTGVGLALLNAPTHALARSALQFRQLYPDKPIHFHDRNFGGYGVDEVYIYPTPVPVS